MELMEIINDFAWCLEHHTIAVILLFFVVDCDIVWFAIWMLLFMYVIFPG